MITLKTILTAAPAIILAIAASACKSEQKTAEEYFVGTNFWYGPILAGKGEGSDHARLSAELDSLKSLGIRNLRVLAGADGPDGIDVKVSPVLQTRPGEYDENLMNGLGNFLKELEKRDMKAVIYLNNAWEWSGGYGAYLEWAGDGVTPNTRTEGYSAYTKYASRFITNEKAKNFYYKHLETVVKKFKDSDAIYSWQIGNEPRCFSDDPKIQDAFVDFIWKSAKIIKTADPDHMVSIGSEGKAGCEQSLDLYKRISECPDVDYLNIHIWPYNWGWAKEESLAEDLPQAINNTDKYIDEHIKIAEKLGKKITLEEFGFPRDGFKFSKEATTEARDLYYKHIFERVVESARKGGALIGCNFWGWGGLAEPAHEFWQKGDDYCCDPSQEAQGLNSVFLTDRSTINIIKETTAKLRSLVSAKVDLTDRLLFTDGAERKLRVQASSFSDAEAEIEINFVSDTTLMSSRDTILTVCAKAQISAGKVSEIVFPFYLGEGFYQVCVHISTSAGEEFDLDTFNIGVEPEKIVSLQDKKDDFDEFWAKNLAELKAAPMKVDMTKIEEKCDTNRNVYRVEITSTDGHKMGGILAEPVKDGKYPAYIEYMGYGADVYPYRGGEKPDAIQFLVSIREQGIFREDSRKDNGRWIDEGLQSKDTFYYKGAFQDAVRAVDFIAAREKTDTTRIFGMGESQGGALTWIAASLDHRFRAIAPAVPFLSDYKDYGKIVWWPVHEILETCDKEGISREKIYDLLTYFDVKNFTDKIECPVYMAFGLQDPTCPPHTNFAGYNQVKTDKQYLCVPLCGHGMWEIPEWAERRDAWFESFETRM